jgi:hypothetical protein
MQHAIVAQLRRPPVGCRELVRAYARTRAAALRQQAASCVALASPTTRAAMERARDELDEVLVSILKDDEMKTV